VSWGVEAFRSEDCYTESGENMDLLGSADLVNKSGSRVTAKDALKDKVGVGFYFSASWCPPCKRFTPLLAQAYAQSRTTGSGGGIEIIFVSSDRSEQDFTNYLKGSHGNWFGLSPGHPVGRALSNHFSVQGIPALKVVGLDGSIIAEDGRQDIMSLGSAAFSQWERLAPSPVDVSVVQLLSDNEQTVKSEACDILVRLLTNIVKDPSNIKYRQVKLTNPKIESKLLPAAGAFEVLFCVGFEEADDKLIMPLSASIQKVEKFVEAIEKVRKTSSIQNPVTKSSSTTSSSAAGSIAGSSSMPTTTSSTPQSVGGAGASRHAASTDTTAGVNLSAAGVSSPIAGAAGPMAGPSTAGSSTLLMPDVLAREHEFHQKLLASIHHMKSYEDPEAQAAACAVMPVDAFKQRAKQKLDKAKESDPGLPDSLLRDLLLLEFKEWFKTDFFKWVDAPKCDRCGGDTTSQGIMAPTQQERFDGAARVEGYQCMKCGIPVRFPRYHAKPAKLLETRRGRCGEWANCFVLCCRALGFDTRHVLDWTDHVWSEVWSETEQRWMHVDPGEAVDKPLVYEAGWGKKLTYVVASSKDEIQDVTWRYSKDHSATTQRRKLVRPKWLVRSLLKLTDQIQEQYKPEEKSRLTQRRLKDCLEMLTPRKVKEDDKVGRKTGSLAWRLARGELGAIGDVDPVESGWVFRPSAEEIGNGSFSVQFFMAGDYYLLGDGSKKEGWKSGVNQVDNVTKKKEHDWKKVYLARTEGCTESKKGTISWKFKIPDEARISDVKLLVQSEVFQSGRIVWQLCGESACLLPQPGKQLQSAQLNGSKEISLSASLSGGQGELAWQHTQLFRTNMEGQQEAQPGFSITFQLKL